MQLAPDTGDRRVFELSDDLLQAAAGALGLREPADARSPLLDPEPAGHPVLRYATGEEATGDYRRIMRALYLEHQAFGLRQRPEQVAQRVRERYGLTLPSEVLERRLEQLHTWGALDREHDASLADTAAEWRRNRYTYDVTREGRLTEGLLATLDQLGRDHGALDASRIPNILDALGELIAGLERESPDGAALRRALEGLLNEVDALHKGALAFMKDLGALIRRAEEVDEAEFASGKGALIDHLQHFRRDRRRWSHDVLERLDRIEELGSGRLVSLIADAKERVALPGGPTVEEQLESERALLEARWRGLRAWFVSDERRDSPWHVMNDQVIVAVRAVLDIAERLAERHSGRVDRGRVHLRLAALATAAAPGEATPLVRGALGIRSPRHLGVPELDPDQVVDRGRRSWYDAEPAPVVAHLRRPGHGAPGRGRGAPIPDLAAGRAALAARRLAERAELESLLTRFAGAGPLRVSDLERVDEREFARLLAWIGRAYEAPPGPDGARRASSTDGRALIRLAPPGDPERRAVLQAPHGRLDLPDFVIEVTRR